MDTKTISFAIMMGVLGNVLFAISYYAGYLAPGIALDFSLIAAFVAGFYGGPFIGFVSGLFVGAFPGVMFGPLGLGSWLGLFGLPLGKGLSGLTAGIISRHLKLGQEPRSSLLAIPSSLVAYVPECLFTYSYFAYLMPAILGTDGTFIFLTFILPKALSEVAIISFLMAAITGNLGFNNFMSRFFVKTHVVPKLQTEKAS